MIRYLCDCGNYEPGDFDVYVSQGELCGVLTVVCRQCRDIKEDFVSCSRDMVMWMGARS